MSERKATEKKLHQAIGDVMVSRHGPERIQELQHRYRSTGNPLYCWEAIMELYGKGHPCPPWVEDYLLDVAISLHSGKSGNDALELTDKHQRMRYRNNNVDMVGAMIEAMLQVLGRSRTNQQIRDFIMYRFEIEEETFKKWWRQYRERKRR